MYGRRLSGAHTFAVRARDRAPGIKQPLGLTTLPRDGSDPPAISVRVVNVDTIKMIVRAVPDSLEDAVLSTPSNMRYWPAWRTLTALRESFVVRIPTRARFNAETTLAIRLPKETILTGAKRLHAVQFAIGSRLIAPESVTARATRPKTTQQPPAKVSLPNNERTPLQLAPILSTGLTESVSDLGLVVQISDVTAHAKFVADRVAAFITDAGGAAIAGADVTVFAAGRRVLAVGTTGSDGLAITAPLAVYQPATDAGVVRDPPLQSMRYLEVARGNERMLLPLRASIAATNAASFQPSSLGATDGVFTDLRGAVTTDRDIYRPGEMLYAKAYVRRACSMTWTP